MKKYIIRWGLLAGLLLCPYLISGTFARKVTLEECLDSAFALNPVLRAASLEADKSRILQATAFNPPMTEIVLKQETTGGGGPENGVAFSQEFDFPSLYVARHKSLKANTALEDSRLLVKKAEVEEQVTALFYSALYYRRLLALNADLGNIYKEFLRVALVRQEEGESGMLEVINARRVYEKNEMEEKEVSLQYQSALIDLRRIAGLDEDAEPAECEFDPIAWSAPADTFDFSSTLRGSMERNRLTLAEREITVARNEFLPSFKIGATAQALIKSFNPYHVDRQRFEPGNFMGFEVGVSVPLFFGSARAKLRAANADKQITMLLHDSAAREADAEVSRLSSRLASLKSRLSYFLSDALPDADEIKRLALVSYELGEIGYLEYIANMETAFGVYQDYAALVNEYNQTVIKLKNLSK